MKAPEGGSRKLSEEEKKDLIEKAQTIDELCAAIKQIGSISKGFLRGKTNVPEVIKSLKKAYKDNNPSLIHNDTSYYSEGSNFSEIIRKLISLGHVRNMSEQEKTDYIQTAETPTELYKRIREIGNFELKLGVDDSEIQIKQIAQAGSKFMGRALNGLILNPFYTVSNKYGLQEKVRSLCHDKINSFFREYIHELPLDMVTNRMEIQGTDVKYNVSTVSVKNQLHDYFNDETVGNYSGDIPHITYFAYVEFKGMNICAYHSYQQLNKESFEKSRAASYLETYLKMILNYDKNPIFKDLSLTHIFYCPDFDRGPNFIESYKKEEAEAPIPESKSSYDDHLEKLQKKEPSTELPKLKYIEKTRLVARVVADLRQSKFTNYQDYLHSALY